MSALSSLLVRDDVVSIHRIEDALQRQVLEGGDIDTALLELSAAPENVVSSYRGALFGVPAASRAHLMGQEPHTLAAVPREVAERYRIVPLWIDHDVLVIAVATPPSERVMAELEALLKARVSIRIATEMRVELALAAHYGIVIPGRFLQLGEQLAKQEPGVLRTVAPLRSMSTRPPPPAALPLLPDSPPAPAALPLPPNNPPPAVAKLQAFSIGAPPPPTAAFSDVARDRPIAFTPSAAPPERVRRHTIPAGSLNPAPPTATAHVSSPPPPSSVTPLAGSHSDRSPPPRESARPEPAPAARVRRVRSMSVETMRGPLTRARADELLDAAEHRNAIIAVFFAYARQYFDCAAMFAVREDRAVGLEAYGLAGIGDIRSLSLPLDRTGTLDEMLRSLAPRVADLSRRPADRRLASVLGRLSGQPAAVIPISLRQRVVLFLYGDRSAEAFEIESLSELISFVPGVSRAFERVIRESKALAAGAVTAMREEEAAAAEPPPTPAAVLVPPQRVPDFSRVPDAAQPARTSAVPNPALNASTRDAFSTLGVARDAPPPPRPDVARRVAQTETQTEIETRATQKLKVPSSLPPPPIVATQTASEPSRRDTYSLLSGKAPSARGSYSMQDAVTDVLQTPRSETPRSEPPPKRAVEQVKPTRRSERPSARPPSRTPDPRVAARTDARREDGDAAWTTDVVRLPSKPLSSPPPRDDGPRSDPPRRISEPAPPRRAVTDGGLELDGLLRDLVSSGPDDEAPFVGALVRLGDAVLPELVRCFPGPLWFDRREPFQRLPPGRDVSAVARALFAFHQRALPLLLDVLVAPEPDLRFYALLLAADINAESVVARLVPLLSDPDAQVKDLARTLLLKVRHMPSFVHVLEDLRGTVALDRLAPERRIDALQVLAALRDADSVDVLVLAMSATDHRVANAALDALRTVTGQDCGTSPRKWQTWFNQHGKRPRIEWLIDGLMHSDEAVRTTAGNELQRATQQYFGFHPGSPKNERERVQKKYQEWWKSRKG